MLIHPVVFKVGGVAREKHKIIYLIVGFVSVYMMNMFAGLKFSSDVFFHYISMYKGAFAIPGFTNVSVITNPGFLWLVVWFMIFLKPSSFVFWRFPIAFHSTKFSIHHIFNCSVFYFETFFTCIANFYHKNIIQQVQHNYTWTCGKVKGL